MKRVLVLCTGNSCRSIMAEGLINHLGHGQLSAVSAGSKPAGYVHPQSLQTLAKHGITVDQPSSQSWDAYADQAFDYVITVCDEAAQESCPLFPGEHVKLHWSTPDPAKATGSEAEIQAAFESAYQLLEQRIKDELL